MEFIVLMERMMCW